MREFFPEHLRIVRKDRTINGAGLFAHACVWLMAIWFVNLLSTLPVALLTECDGRGVIGWPIAKITGESYCALEDDYWADSPDWY